MAEAIEVTTYNPAQTAIGIECDNYFEIRWGFITVGLVRCFHEAIALVVFRELPDIPEYPGATAVALQDIDAARRVESVIRRDYYRNLPISTHG